MATRIRLRRDTAANWTLANPVLYSGEAGAEIDTGNMKVGDGVRNWSELEYVGSGSGGSMDTSSLENAIRAVVVDLAAFESSSRVISASTAANINSVYASSQAASASLSANIDSL